MLFKIIFDLTNAHPNILIICVLWFFNDSGDDCISIVNASSNIKMKRIQCGPGHGIRYHVNFMSLKILPLVSNISKKVYIFGPDLDQIHRLFLLACEYLFGTLKFMIFMVAQRFPAQTS